MTFSHAICGGWLFGLLLQCKHHTVANVSPINWKKLKAYHHVPNSCKLKGVEHPTESCTKCVKCFDHCLYVRAL